MYIYNISKTLDNNDMKDKRGNQKLASNWAITNKRAMMAL